MFMCYTGMGEVSQAVGPKLIHLRSLHCPLGFQNNPAAFVMAPSLDGFLDFI